MKSFMSVVLAAVMFKPEGAVETAPEVRQVTTADLDAIVGFAPGELQAAVTAKDIAASFDEVSISDKASPTGKGAVKSYVRLEALTLKGQSVLCHGKTTPQTAKPAEGEDTRTDEQKRPGACDYFNYGFDLDVRAPIRQSLMNTLEGPEKAVKKAVAGLLAMGLEGDTLRTAIKNSPKFSGVDGIDKFIDTALKG